MSCQRSHSHGHGHNHDDSDHVLPIPTNAAQSLRTQIDFQRLTALNVEQQNSDIYKIFDKHGESKYQVADYVSSDADQQLILNVPFLDSSIKLYSVILRTSAGGTCPKKIQLFKNKNNLDFDNIEDTKPDFTLTHPDVGVESEDNEDVAEDRNENTFVEHFLPRHVFTGVTQLTLFVESVHDEDEDTTRIYYVELRGEFKRLTKDPVITLYESAANPADHKNLATSTEQNQHSVQ